MKRSSDLEGLVQSTFAFFSTQVGADQIATRQALRVLGNYAVNTTPNSILEIGSGIGTITNFLLTLLSNPSYFALERDSWCREILVNQIPENKISLIQSVSELPQDFEFDFVVIDDLLSIEETRIVVSKLQESFVIFIEGHRYHQRKAILLCLKENKVSFSYKTFHKSKDSYKGAGVFQSISRKNRLLDFLMLQIYKFRINLLILFMKFRSIRSRFSIRKLIGMPRKKGPTSA